MLTSKYRVPERSAGYLKQAEARLIEDIASIDAGVTRSLNKADEDVVGFMRKLFGVPHFGRYQ